jgi:general secretion pathway protein F
MLAMLIERHVPAAEAIELSGAAVGPLWLRIGCRRVANRMREGESLSAAISRAGLFPPTLLAVVSWGESLPALAESLNIAAELFHSRASRQLSLVQRVAPAFAFLIVIIAVGFLVSAVITPMVRIIETLT